jgi:6-carboxyhexanoate--CoA ligase
MRASQKAKSQTTKTSVKKCGFHEIHISGAEGIYEETEIEKIVREYTLRALIHQKGKPDSIVISVEQLEQDPQAIKSLPVMTLACRSILQSRSLIQNLLKSSGISNKAINTSFTVINSSHIMRGAALVLSGSGKRIEPDKDRGIRASKLGTSTSADKTLSRKLVKHGINNATVREAIVLASKVAACPQVIAELCVSDDPDYTTGYVSSKKYGYVRIPHMKKKGQRIGGRVFFLEEDADISTVITFLEKTPVIINSVSAILGVRTLNEIIDYTDK